MPPYGNADDRSPHGRLGVFSLRRTMVTFCFPKLNLVVSIWRSVRCCDIGLALYSPLG